LLAELTRTGLEGRQKIVSEWSRFLPSNVDAAFSLLSESVPPQQAAAAAPANTSSAGAQDVDDDDDDENLLSGGKMYAFPCLCNCICNTSSFFVVRICSSMLRLF